MHEGLTGRALFRAVAPRLERAHRERLVELARERRARTLAREILQAAEYRVAHRELQLQRAVNQRRAGHYIALRTRKLDQAREQVVAAERHALRLGAIGSVRRAA